MAKAKQPNTKLEETKPEAEANPAPADEVVEDTATKAEDTEPKQTDNKDKSLFKKVDKNLSAFMDSFKQLTETQPSFEGSYKLFEHFAESLHVSLKFNIERD